MVEYGKHVTVSYVGRFSDGSIFDSTEGIEPLEFKVGAGSVIHGFDEVVSKMSVGEKVMVEIPAHEAYGEYFEEKIQTAPMASIPGAKDIEMGKTFYFITKEGLRFPAKVLEVEKGIARIDFNHPLAGKNLIFDIELLSVSD